MSHYSSLCLPVCWALQPTPPTTPQIVDNNPAFTVQQILDVHRQGRFPVPFGLWGVWSQRTFCFSVCLSVRLYVSWARLHSRGSRLHSTPDCNQLTHPQFKYFSSPSIHCQIVQLALWTPVPASLPSHCHPGLLHSSWNHDSSMTNFCLHGRVIFNMTQLESVQWIWLKPF